MPFCKPSHSQQLLKTLVYQPLFFFHPDATDQEAKSFHLHISIMV